MEKELRPGRRTSASLLGKISVVVLKTLAALVLIALLAVFVTSVSPIYDFAEPRPFSGPDIFNPYRDGGDSAFCWKRANFHTHTRVKGILNECEHWPDETDAAYRKFGYDIVTFSNHNELTVHPYDPLLQVNVYEHGYNLFKYHKLVFGCSDVNLFDHLVPLFASQKQFQLDLLGKESDFIQMNHPLRTIGTSEDHMRKLGGYRIMELDSGKSKENEYWDWALSAGHYSFGLANDDLHFPDRSSAIAVRCNFLCCPSARYEDIRKTLLGGCYYAMRVPDYGRGDWEVKYERNRHLPSIERIGLDGQTVYIALSCPADSIKVTGQDHATLALALKNAESGGMGETSPDVVTVAINGIRMILGLPVGDYYEARRSQFYTACSDMLHQYLTSDGTLSMIGQGVVVTGLILALFFAAWLVAGQRGLRVRIGLFALFSSLCFLGYNLMLALSYGFIFVPFQAEQLVDYNRYIYSYYIGWFILALGCLSVALLPQITVKGGADGPTAVFTAVRRQPHAVFELFVLALACGMLFRQNQLILPQLSVLGFADSEFTDRRAERAEAELVCSYLAPDDRVFYVGQGDNGEGWFSAVFDFYPILVDYSGTVTTDPDTGETKMIGGGGELGLPELQPGEGVKNTYYHAFTAEELDSIVRGNGCTVLYIQTLDDIFVQSYADLFTDKLAAAQSGETLLYRVTDAGFAPMPMEVSAQ